MEISMVGGSGGRHVLGYVSSGQILNLIPILDDQPAIHDASAHGSCTVLLVPKRTFLAAIASEPEFAQALIRLLCLRSRSLYDRFADSALLSLRTRCARALLSLIPSYGSQQPDSISITLKFSQNQLADMLGVTRQSVNRELKQLNRRGIIRTGYQRFDILDPDALRAAAQVTQDAS